MDLVGVRCVGVKKVCVWGGVVRLQGECRVDHDSLFYLFIYLFLIIYLLNFRERGKEGEREGEKHQCVVSHVPSTGDPAHNPGMRPDWELNR